MWKKREDDVSERHGEDKIEGESLRGWQILHLTCHGRG